MTPTNWTHSYPYEPGPDGEAAYIRFEMPGHSYTATVFTVESLANWIYRKGGEIESYTIERPGGFSSAALDDITTDLLAAIEHVYSTPDGRDWDYALAGIREWERAEEAAQRAERLGRVEVGDYLTLEINQGIRDAYVVAVSEGGDKSILEYIMPNRRTYLVQADTVNIANKKQGHPWDDNYPDYLPYRTFGSRIPKWAVDKLDTPERQEARETLWDDAEDRYGITGGQQRSLDRAIRKGVTIFQMMDAHSSLKKSPSTRSPWAARDVFSTYY